VVAMDQRVVDCYFMRLSRFIPAIILCMGDIWCVGGSPLLARPQGAQFRSARPYTPTLGFCR
jgi:hypothetical protein